jgi:Na+/H+-dicarboxylate symporter
MLLVSLALGIVVGVTIPSLVPLLSWLGRTYLALLQLCALPIMLSGIVAGVYRLVVGHNSRAIVLRLVAIVMAGFMVCNSLAILIGWASQTRRLDVSTLAALGAEVNRTGIDGEIHRFSLVVPSADPRPGLSTLLNSLISDNIFASLATGQTLQVLTFSIILGVALSLLPASSARHRLVSFFDLIFQVFGLIADVIVACLPIGLIGLFAEQFATTSIDVMRLMLGFVLVANLSLIAVYGLSVFVIWICAHRPRRQRMLVCLKETTVLALSTSSSLASLPYALKMMPKLRFNSEEVNSLLPINLITFRYGTSIYFALATMFILKIYQEPFGLNQFLTIAIGCLLASLSSIGAAGVAALGCLEVVTSALGLPIGAALLIFVAIDPFINPLRALVNVYAAMAITAIVTDNSETALNPP